MAEMATFFGEKTESGTYKTYSSFNSEAVEDKKKFFNAISAPESLKDVKGSIDLQHAYIEEVNYKNKNEETGEEEQRPGLRLILVDKNMKGFKTSSIGVANALERMIDVFGPLPWEPAISVKSVKNTTANGQNIRILEFA